MISLILARKIVSLFIIMLLGWLLVRRGIVRAQDSKVLSVISLYLVMPCVIISSFQVEYKPEIFKGLLLALVQDSVDSISSMVGPMAVLLLGMLIADMDLKKFLNYRHLWWITLLRLVGIPMVGVLLLKYRCMARMRIMQVRLM